MHLWTTKRPARMTKVARPKIALIIGATTGKLAINVEQNFTTESPCILLSNWHHGRLPV